MRDHYDFSGGVRGKYVKPFAQGTNIVLLEPDTIACKSEAILKPRRIGH